MSTQASEESPVFEDAIVPVSKAAAGPAHRRIAPALPLRAVAIMLVRP